MTEIVSAKKISHGLMRNACRLDPKRFGCDLFENSETAAVISASGTAMVSGSARVLDSDYRIEWTDVNHIVFDRLYFAREKK